MEFIQVLLQFTHTMETTLQTWVPHIGLHPRQSIAAHVQGHGILSFGRDLELSHLTMIMRMSQ